MTGSSSYLRAGFSQPVDTQKFGLPDALRAPGTKKSLVRYNLPEIKHRVIEEISWNSDYSRVVELEAEIVQTQRSR